MLGSGEENNTRSSKLDQRRPLGRTENPPCLLWFACFLHSEGDFKAVRGLPYGSIVGAYSNLLLHQGIATVIRTADIFETKFVLTQLAQKCQAIAKPVPLGVVCSKRKREGDTRSIWIRQLACIPTISENIAVTLLDHFGSMSALREALSSPETFPVVQLSRDSCLGKKRIAKLATILVT